MTTVDEAQDEWQDHVFFWEPREWYYWNVVKRGLKRK